MATVCTMEASYQLAVSEEDLEKSLNYCRLVFFLLWWDQVMKMTNMQMNYSLQGVY